MRRSLVGQFLMPGLVITIASGVYALGFVWCYAPNHIAFGGITGIAQIINRYIPAAPVGILVIVLNVPLFLLPHFCPRYLLTC